MNNEAINIYSQIFNSSYEKGADFYRAVFTVPVHPDALKSVLTANSESVIRGSSSIDHPNVQTLREFFKIGVDLLADAIIYRKDDFEVPGPDGDDITLLSANLSLNSSMVVSAFEEGEDITTLNSKLDKAKPIESLGTANTETTLKSSVLISDAQNQTIKITNKPDYHLLDDELRCQLITNILTIFQVWFQSLHATNLQSIAKFKSAKQKVSFASIDIVAIVFQLPGSPGLLNDLILCDLLSQIKWKFDSITSEIKEAEYGQNLKSLRLLKEVIFLVSDILKTLFLSIHHYKESSNEFTIVKSLLYSFYKVDFAQNFQTLLDLSNPAFDADEESFIEPKIMMSFEALIKVYSFLGSLANVPSSLLPVTPVSLSSDITNLKNESPNVYEHLSIRIKTIDNINYREEFESKLIPIFASNFNFLYRFREDLLINQIQNSSFFNWLTSSKFSDNLYVISNTVENVTNFKLNYANISLTGKANDPYLREIDRVYEKRLKMFNIENEGISEENSNLNLNLPELLPITLLLYTFTRNITFLLRFTKQINEIKEKIEDINVLEDKTIELYEIWLCLLSYIFQYQYKSRYIESTTKLSLIILLRITAGISEESEVEGVSVLDNVTNYQINEFKWKLSHQKSPIVPNNKDNYGIKSSLFYILDIIQNLVRFNLTKKLDVENYRLGLNVVYQILQRLHKVVSSGADSDFITQLALYPWNELTNTLIQLIRFIKVQDLLHYKYFQNKTEQVKTLIEEMLVILDTVLQFRNFESTSSVTYDLVYAILLNFEIIKSFTTEETNGQLSSLNECLEYFEERFHLTEESKQSQKQKIDLFEVDFDSPMLTEEINKFIDPTNRDNVKIGQNKDTAFKHKETLKINGISSDTLIKIFNDLYKA